MSALQLVGQAVGIILMVVGVIFLILAGINGDR